MADERFCNYRSGVTDACALTSAKGVPRLPIAAAPDGRRFWMQIGLLPQAEDSRPGFSIPQAAAGEIAAKGYYPFTKSQKLLGVRLLALSAPSSEGGTSNA